MSREAKETKVSDDSSSPRAKLRPILSSEFTQDVPLEDVYVGILKEKRNISKAIKSISSAFPGFGHLKRCNGLRLLLSPTETTSPDELKASLTSKGFDLSIIEDDFKVMAIPSKPSKTKRQAKVCCDIWPVNFHPDPITESIISGDIFSEDKLIQMELLMRSTLDAAVIESIGNSECNGSALIVDPESGEPLALASSKLDQHPLFHAAIIAIDLVAKIQGGGAWDLIDHENRGTAKRKLSDSLPLRYPPSLAGVKLPRAEPLELSQKSKPKTKEEKTGPYLCTNFWIFLVQEPCALCAMALLHSRASKIFYGVGTSSGVLGSKAMLHTTPGLNHRYQVWSGILENECKNFCESVKDTR